METEEEDRFETSQTVVAVFLYYSGFEIVEMVWDHGRCTFYFDNTPSLQQSFAAFCASAGRVEPQGFNNAYGEVKNRMFAARDQAVDE